MSDTGDTRETGDSAEEAERGPVAGERLAAARRELKIPVDDIVKELHLDEPKVRALERNDFERLGAPVFAKGHLRKYAQLVDVPESEVIGDYVDLNRTVPAPEFVPGRPAPKKELALGPWLIAGAIFLVIALLYWWFVERDPGQSSTPAATTGAEISEQLPQDRLPERGEPVPAEAAPIEEVADEPAASEPAPEAAPPVEIPAVLRLTMQYSGDCWTEITDAAGRRLFFNLGTAGRTVNVSGEPPFNVLFGNADNVDLEVNGAAYAFPAGSRRGRTARFTLTVPQ